MLDSSLPVTPSKLTPVLIGALAMTATFVIPIIQMINCLCCAGIMGGAILGVWYYKKSFAPEMPFSVKDGTTIGALSGLLAAGLTTVIMIFQLGLTSSTFQQEFSEEMDQAFEQMEVQGQDPATVEQIRQMMIELFDSPEILLALMLITFLIIFTGFGALGGVIGGNIFKTKYVEKPMTGPTPQ